MTDAGMAAHDNRTHDRFSAVDDADDIISVGGDTCACLQSGRITHLAGDNHVVVFETNDEHFRRALVTLGWIPPVELTIGPEDEKKMKLDVTVRALRHALAEAYAPRIDDQGAMQMVRTLRRGEPESPKGSPKVSVPIDIVYSAMFAFAHWAVKRGSVHG